MWPVKVPAQHGARGPLAVAALQAPHRDARPALQVARRHPAGAGRRQRARTRSVRSAGGPVPRPGGSPEPGSGARGNLWPRPPLPATPLQSAADRYEHYRGNASVPGGLPRYRHYNESLNILEALAGGRIDLQAGGGVGWGPKLQIAFVRVTILRCQACTCSLCPCQTTPPPSRRAAGCTVQYRRGQAGATPAQHLRRRSSQGVRPT